LLRQHEPNRPLDPSRQIIETLIGFAACNRPVNRIKFNAAVVKRAEREENKKYFLDDG